VIRDQGNRLKVKGKRQKKKVKENRVWRYKCKDVSLYMKFVELDVWNISARFSVEIFKEPGNKKNYSFRD